MCSAALRILQVEDTPMNRQVLDDMLRSLGHIPWSVATVAEALEALGRQAFDLILADLHMPVAGGLELLQTLSRSERSFPPVVLVTADVISQDPRTYLRLGFADVLPKPITLAHLQQAITRAQQLRDAAVRSLFG